MLSDRVALKQALKPSDPATDRVEVGSLASRPPLTEPRSMRRRLHVRKGGQKKPTRVNQSVRSTASSATGDAITSVSTPVANEGRRRSISPFTMSNSGIFPYLRREAKLEPLTRVARPLSDARPAFISSILRGTNSVQNLSGAYVPFALSTETLVERTIGHLAPIAVHCRDDARLAPRGGREWNRPI